MSLIGARLLRCLMRLGESEVENLDLPPGGDLDVGRLEISMHDALGVCGLQTLGNLPGDIDRLVDWNWSPLEPSTITSPLSPASIERLPGRGDLLMTWNNNYKAARDGGKRTPFNVAISRDEGKTWEKIKSVES